ncbi:MAG TPA: LLM class flavin-dependent oxidoreductase, partial [Gammaproteobacteria bacterium]|nr:LLM class flavin-dependent oxidoreductase [Gammaproteobacteria bacterium]
ECAILDILTGGRLNVGLGRGVPRDDLKHGLDRDTAQARFEEGAEIIRRAWTEDTFTYAGTAWNYIDISCRPRPLQKPHPPIYYGATSLESPAIVARQGWNLALSRQPLANCVRAIKIYREERAALGNPPGGGDAIMVREIYVADSDERAWAEAGPEITRFWQLPLTTTGAASPSRRTIFLGSQSASPISRGALPWRGLMNGAPRSSGVPKRSSRRRGE